MIQNDDQWTEGYFFDISNHDYHNGLLKNILGSGHVKDFRRSAAHFLANFNSPEIKKTELTFGNAYHVKILESKEFKKRVILGLNRQRRSAADKQAWTEFERRHENKFIISQDEMQKIDQMYDTMKNHETAMSYFTQPGYSEVTFIWRNDWGIWCKCRPDFLIVYDDHAIIIDLKTAVNAMAFPFGRAINQFGYDVSACWYKTGVEYTLEIPVRFFWVVQEKDPPFAVNVFEADQEIMDSARNKIRPLMTRFAECLKTQVWQAYPPGVKSVRMPSWGYAWNVEQQQF